MSSEKKAFGEAPDSIQPAAVPQPEDKAPAYGVESKSSSSLHEVDGKSPAKYGDEESQAGGNLAPVGVTQEAEEEVVKKWSLSRIYTAYRAYFHVFIWAVFTASVPHPSPRVLPPPPPPRARAVQSLSRDGDGDCDCDDGYDDGNDNVVVRSVMLTRVPPQQMVDLWPLLPSPHP